MSLATTQVAASGAVDVARPAVASTAGRFDCFYVYPRVGPAGPGAGPVGPGGDGASLAAESAQAAVAAQEAAVATEQAARFSQVCRVWAPLYDQGLNLRSGAIAVADSSVEAAFEDYLAHDNDGRPIIFIGHSEGAITLSTLLSSLVDANPGLRSRMVLAILLGGNVEVPVGKVVGGSFGHIPLCTAPGEAGCVIAYSTFPGTPPPDSMFGRPGQGVSLITGQTATAGREVACVNPAAIGGGTADLDPIFSTGFTGSQVQETAFTTPWTAYPSLYEATCQHRDGASWLQVAKATGSFDRRPTVTEEAGPTYGYHTFDVNLALGNLVADVAAAESTWSRLPRPWTRGPACPAGTGGRSRSGGAVGLAVWPPRHRCHCPWRQWPPAGVRLCGRVVMRACPRSGSGSVRGGRSSGPSPGSRLS